MWFVSEIRFTLVWKDEWEKLIGYYEYDVEIQVVQLVEPDGQVNIVTLPGMCGQDIPFWLLL